MPNIKDRTQIIKTTSAGQIEGATWNLVPFPQDRQAIDVGDFTCDYSSFSSDFGWKPKIRFEERIKRSIEYYQSELKHYI